MRYGLALALLLLAAPADAGTVCGQHADILVKFAKQFDEHPVARALSHPGAIFEVLASPEGKTWTVILTPPNGPTCVIGTGEYWQELAPSPQGEQS